MKLRMFAGVALVSLLSAGSANAAIAGISTLASLGANDTLSWGQAPAFQTLFLPGSFTTAHGASVTVSSVGGNAFRFDSPGLLPGDGAYVATGSGGPDLTFTFAHPVFGAGAYILPDYSGAFGAQIIASNGGVLATFNRAGSSGGPPVFIGLLSDTANIASISFHLTSAIRNPEDFITGTLSINAAPEVAGVPEPTVWAMLLMGLASAGVALRRRTSRA